MSPAATARPPAAAHGGEIDILRSFARRIDPSDAGAYNNLGVLYFRKGLTDEAIVAFSRALALDERMGVARRNLEIAYGESGILERRLHDLEERLRANPEDLEALVELAEEGMTMVCVTHEMGFARTVADTMVFMDRGEIVERGPPKEFFANPKSERTRLFLSQILAH